MENQTRQGPQQLNNTHAPWDSFPTQQLASYPPVGQNAKPEQMSGAAGTLPEEDLQHASPAVPYRPSNRRKLLVIIGSICGLVGILRALFLGSRFILKSTANVTLYQVNVQNVTQYVGGGGIVFPQQQLDVTYPETEQAVDVLVKAGDAVTPNQPMIKLDTSQLNIQIKQASDAVAAAQAYLDSVSAGGSSLAIAQAQQQYTIAQSRYNALVSQASSVLLHNGNLVSPMSGVVTQVDVNPGQVFAANTPLLTIMDESTVIVHVKIPLADLGQVHVGQSALVTPSAIPNINLAGQVSSIVPQADPQTDTFEVWVSVLNSDKNLLPGMSAFVRIQSSARAIVVPRLAVLNADRDSAVFVEREIGRASCRERVSNNV
jgi:RND family efflux transporter MFP subunit